MRKFEYQLVNGQQYSGRPLETSLNKMGAEGWQLISIEEIKGCKWYFWMREIPQANPQHDVDV